MSKILFISSVFPPDIGGPSQQAESLVLRFAAIGLPFVLVVPADKQVNQAGFGPGRVVQIEDIGRGARGPVWRILRLVYLFHKIGGTILRTRPSVAHIQVFGDTYGLISLLVCRLAAIPTVLKLTGEKHLEWAGEHGVGGWRVALLRVLDACQIHFSSIVWVTSPQYYSHLIDSYRVPQGNVFFLPNFIDLAPFDEIAERRAAWPLSPEGGLRVLCVARLRPWKGIEHTLRACAIAGPVVESVTIVGEGDEDYTARLRELAATLGLGPRAVFLPAMPPKEIPSVYRQADVFMLLSDYEPFGIVLVEAMTAGLAVIATSVGGIPSVLGEIGSRCLVPTGDFNAAADRLVALARHPIEAKGMVGVGRLWARRFGIEHGVDRLTQAYAGLSQGTKIL